MTITLDEIKRDPLSFTRRLEAGEALIILAADKAVAKVEPIVPSSPARRPFGLCRGEFEVPDNFDEPLPEEVLTLFEGG